MGLNNQINMVLAPGHLGLEGNERANKEARCGSVPTTYGPQPFILIPQSFCVKTLKDTVKGAVRWGHRILEDYIRSIFQNSL